MKRTWLSPLLIVVFVTALGTAGCGGSSSGTSTDGDTDTVGDGDNSDTDNTETADGDTETTDGDTEETSNDNTCINDDTCPTQGDKCHKVLFECMPAECTANAECFDGANQDRVCDGGLCYDKSCAKDAECSTGKVCSGGVCGPAPVVGDIARVTLFASTNVIANGQNVTLVATGWNANGAAVTTDANAFDWETSSATAATVANGVATGGTDSGAVTITAKVKGAADKMASVVLRNFGAVAAGKARAVVFDIKTGEFLKGATVMLGAETKTTGATEADAGVVEFDAPAGTSTDLHVFAAGHQWVSAFGLATDMMDWVVPVEPLADTTKAGGIHGELDYSGIPAALKEDIKVGIAGMAIPGNLLDIQFTSLIGDSINRRIKLGTIVDQDVPLPGGIQLEIGVNKVSPEFYGFSSGGASIAWALGGYLPLQDVIDIASDALGGGSGDIPIGPILAQVIPFLENFYHGLLTGLNITLADKIADANDINGDGKTDDLVFDATKFQQVQKGLKLTQQLSATTRVSFGGFDIFGADAKGTGAIVLAGTNIEGIGFLPLGLSISLDEDANGVTDGRLDNIDMKFAPQHHGVSGFPYFFLGLGASVTELLDSKSATGIRISAVMKNFAAGEGYPSTLAIDGFPSFPTSTETLAAAAADTKLKLSGGNSDVYRYVLSGPVNKWLVYVKKDSEANLPAPPAGFDWATVKPADRGDLQINTIDLAGSLTYDGLFQFNDKNLNNLNNLTNGFVLWLPKGE